MNIAKFAIACLAFAANGRRLQRATKANTLESVATILLSFEPATAFGLAPAGAVKLHRFDLASTVSCLSGRSRMAPVMESGCECKYVVVVEGTNDVEAVMKAMGKEAFCVAMNSKLSGRRASWRDVEEALEYFPKADMVILTDADQAGQEYREKWAKQMGRLDSAKHAIIPQRFSQSENDQGHHYRGNVGIEHASPEQIRHAIENAKVYDLDRNKYNMTHLMGWGMAAPFGLNASTIEAVSKEMLPYGSIPERRRLFGEYLGIGDVPRPKDLIVQLNRLFSDEEIEEALASLPGPGDQIPEKTTDGLRNMRDRTIRMQPRFQQRHDDYMKQLWMEKQARLRAAGDEAERGEAAELTSR